MGLVRVLVGMLLALLLSLTIGAVSVWLDRTRRLRQHGAAFGFPLDVEYLQDNPEALVVLRTRIKKVFLLSSRIASGDGLAMFWRYLVFVTDNQSATFDVLRTSKLEQARLAAQWLSKELAVPLEELV